MKLFLLRHGEAQPYQENDESRALTPLGRLEIARKAPLLPHIDQMIVSPYLRAQQSADILIEHGVQIAERLCDERITPDSSIEPIEAQLIRIDLTHQLIVAHNPLLSRLIRHFVGPDAQGVNMHTGALACLDAEDFLAGCARLVWIK